jgi:RNA polymerase sigma factor (TIGR02999 family)
VCLARHKRGWLCGFTPLYDASRLTCGAKIFTVMSFNTKPEAQDVTQWLRELDTSTPDASNELFTLLYDELHRIARNHMHRETLGHTLSATALAHEAWFRMAEQTRTRWTSRSHFLAVSSTMMRRILVNHAMAKHANKRDAALVSLDLTEAQQIGVDVSSDVVAVHDALTAFEAVDMRAAKVVELKFFGGLENEEIAEVLNLSLATVKRDWALARAWLHRELGGGALS